MAATPVQVRTFIAAAEKLHFGRAAVGAVPGLLGSKHLDHLVALD